MNIQEIMEKIQSLYDQQKVEAVKALLLDCIQEAKGNNDVFLQVFFLNELLGIYREKGMRTEGLESCGQLLSLCQEGQLVEDENYGTTLLNVATTYRAFGQYKEANALYLQCLRVYQGKIQDTDYRYASLYNNMSLLYSETGEFLAAIDFLEKSLGILTQHKDVNPEIATANTSLGQLYLKLGELEKAQSHIDLALQLHETVEDYHYSGTLAAAADLAFLQENYEKSVSLYEKAMEEIEKYLGRTENYRILEENRDHALQFMEKDCLGSTSGTSATSQTAQTSEISETSATSETSAQTSGTSATSAQTSETSATSETVGQGMALCRDFYQEHGVPMIATHFPHQASQIAVGLVGHGSECFGFDDCFSRDHDFGAGFCLWLPDALYLEIGEALQREYDKLPMVYQGVARTPSSGEKRVGVFSISGFYQRILGRSTPPVTEAQWEALEEKSLATATNGAVFRDDLGEFTRIRQALLNHYPVEVLCHKVAHFSHEISQKGQYNLPRTLKRGDFFTARLILAQFQEDVLSLAYLLQGVYAPFYKWVMPQWKKLDSTQELTSLLEEFSAISIPEDKNSDKLFETIEKIIAFLIQQLQKKGYIANIYEKEDKNFLEGYLQEILAMPLRTGRFFQDKTQMVEEIVQAEWTAFDKVQGVDGRASCQEDYETFEIMRKSQFLPWGNDLLRSYLRDLEESKRDGRNLITEKYAFMMKSTDPQGFAEIEKVLPSISTQREALQEDIITLQVAMMEALYPKYPKFASQGRSLRSEEDSLYNTSYETYLRGELSTYSEETLALYWDLIQGHRQGQSNLPLVYMQNVAKLYGYKDVESAEASLSSLS